MIAGRRYARARGGFFRCPAALTILLAALGLAACFEETSDPSSAGSDAEVTKANQSARSDPRPSIVLIVVESLRTDALASYGPDRASPLPRGDRSATPNLDDLAKRGLRYAWAIAASSDSVTSHASIFTGLSPERHAAGLWTSAVAGEDLVTLAEDLARVGYETVGFSENPMAGPEFGLDQGFERFVAADAAAASQGKSWVRKFDLMGRLKRWLDRRDHERPYFLFVNLADPHLPYARRENNPYLPSNASETRVENVLALHPHNTRICRKLPDPEAVTILGALYLHEVEAADRKVGRILELTREEGSQERPPIVIATADHGTHFGEQRLLGHHFSVANRVVRVPLIVDAGVARDAEPPSVVEAPVAQRRIAYSIRCWAGDLASCEEALPDEEREDLEPIVSVAGNEVGMRPPAAVVDTHSLTGKTLYANAHCEDDTGMRDRNVAYLKGAMKYVWRRRGPDQAFDLRWDAAEQTDQLERGGEKTRALQAEVTEFVQQNRLDRAHRVADTRPLRDRAEDAYFAGRRALLGGGKTATDAVWFAQLVHRIRPDPEIEAWIERQIPLHVEDPFYPIIDPSGESPSQVPEVLPRGFARFTQYLLASVAGPDDWAMEHLDEYLQMEAAGYALTHQLTALEWARAMGRPLTTRALRRRPALLEAIAQEHLADSVFRDLWVERAAFLLAFGTATEAEAEAWARVVVDHHLGGGDWGHTGSEIRFDGQAKLGEHPREHVRGMALIVLAHYLAQSPLEPGSD